MKSNFLFPKILLAGFFLVFFTTNSIFSQAPVKKDVVSSVVTYTCPMHPEVVADKPGNCTKCGMKLVAISASSMPAELNTIFTNSCMKCHGTGGGSFALSMVDFSKWDQYTAVVQAKKAKTITAVVTNGSMPPQSFIKANPSAALSKDQIELIRKWSDALAAKK
ncbi:MAG: heme-binding domain-containing protein [Bacteroidia bacterium]|nr:heme-binding domain-containing protein [Bacteroidia bacterium]